MPRLFSEDTLTYPLFIRQMIADEQHSPTSDGFLRIEEAKYEWYDTMNPTEFREYLKGIY